VYYLRGYILSFLTPAIEYAQEKLIQSQSEDVDTVPCTTVFVYKSQQSEITYAFFQELQKENATLFRNREEFLALITERYDEFRRGMGN
jgi:hypothetical protein